MISSTGPYHRDEKIILRVTIWGQDNTEHHTTAMIDCGATENFIDLRYAEQNNIPLQQKTIPRRVLAVDGQEVANGPVTHDAMVDLTINNHYETIRLHCITIGNVPIIVGLPWLRKHNPNINWREGQVMFNSARCAKECLISSPHATTVSEEKARGEYYKDTAQDAVS
jgi:predicted aspartyl protease